MPTERAGDAEEDEAEDTPDEIEARTGEGPDLEAAEDIPLPGPEEDATDDSPPMLSRDDLLDPRKTREPETKVVAGMCVRGLSASEMHEAESARMLAMRDATQDKHRLGDGNKAEQAVILAYGVIDPRMTLEEWDHAQKQPGRGGALNQASNTIQELTGIVDWQVELAGKLLKQTQSDTDA